MIKIAHRGNFHGVNKDRENTPSYIEEAVVAGYDVEVDAWLVDGKWMLGHDFPKHEVQLSFFERPNIWTHAKNLIGYVSLYHNTKAHVFWHNRDEFVFTSKGIKWANSDVLTYDGVMVILNLTDNHLQMCKLGRLRPLGICSDDFSRFGV